MQIGKIIDLTYLIFLFGSFASLSVLQVVTETNLISKLNSKPSKKPMFRYQTDNFKILPPLHHNIALKSK